VIASTDRRDRLILLAPIAPATTGNGLAMRCDVFRRAASHDFEVRTLVVPVAGRVPEVAASAEDVTVVEADPARDRVEAKALVADPVWRDRLARTRALPRLARRASFGHVQAIERAIGAGGPVAVHVMRSYLAPLGLAVAERIDAEWVSLDLDDDDAALVRGLGDHGEADAYDRALGVFGPLFDALAAASPVEAEAMGRRHGLTVAYLPNAVEVPDATERPMPQRRDLASLLFVGNLTYTPNVQAALMLVDEVLPRLELHLGRCVRMTLVGRHGPELERLARPGVEVAGFVVDIAAAYRSADAVVVPLRAGGGTRIKILEAFAHGVPVVASRAAASGLPVSHGRHLLLADESEEIAAAVEAILTQPPLAQRLVGEAWALVSERHSIARVVPDIRRFFADAATHQAPGPGAED
jgi:polysaccharide biosynthesis protein PslH